MRQNNNLTTGLEISGAGRENNMTTSKPVLAQNLKLCRTNLTKTFKNSGVSVQNL
jgi:hypothetical protein